jgi:DNA-binding IclR family transcriptional regulator
MIALAEPTDLDTLRLRNEFLEMPGLSVTIPQAARLFGVRQDRAATMLGTLEHEGFLRHDKDGAYRRIRES